METMPDNNANNAEKHAKTPWATAREKYERIVAESNRLEKEEKRVEAKKYRYESFRRLIESWGIRGDDVIKVTSLLPEEERDELFSTQVDEGEFVGIDEEHITIHSPGDDVDVQYPLNEVVDIECDHPSGDQRLDQFRQ